jgi:hypothetical protein
MRSPKGVVMASQAPPVTFHNDRATTGYLLRRTAVVTRYWLMDRARRSAKMSSPSDIPTDPHQLSTPWLTAALSNGLAGARITDFHVPTGDSGTSTRFALRVEWNATGREAGLPTELFVKTTNSWQQRLILGFTGMVKGEPLFYSRFRNELDITAPRGYYGAYDERSWRSIAIMEDISSTQGAQFLSPLQPPDRNGMENLLADLATMHGRLWARTELATCGLRDSFNLISWSDSLVNLRRRSHVGVERAAAVVPREIADRTDDIYDANFRTLELDRAMPSTLLHGDGHAAQRFRTAEGREGLSDWQVVHRGHWAWDVAYTMNSALTVQDRRAWDRELVAYYLDRLASEGGPALAFDDAWNEYRRHCFYPYIAWIFTIGRAAYHPNWQPDEYSMAIIERTGQAIVDHDSLAVLDSAS